ncbi:hypothetical protein BG015_007305 [Linnemannia schmuckeri]|uniref:Uncharacterized protein n=1 Tax=Linnemannia schmuckeri TaxID=64567 RepID=A0A9P5VBE6_9FUNG|nr:hypothetical protein BG015_007305 [Linnemannia schmuckeri]
MSQVKTHRGSLHNPGTPRSQSSSSLASATTTTSSRPRRIHINLPKATATAAAFLSPTTGTSTLSHERIREDRARYAELVAKNATSEALLKMPNVATKPRAIDDVFDHQFAHQASSIAFKLPLVAPPAISNMKVAVDTSSPYTTSTPRFSQQRPGVDRKRSNQGNMNNSEESVSRRNSSMNPLAATFTPTLPKAGSPEFAATEDTITKLSSPSRRNTVDSRANDGMVTGLGISSPTTATAVNPRLSTQPQYDLKTASPTALLRNDRATFDTSFTASSSAPHNNALARTSSVLDFDPEVFRDNLMRQITDKLETGLDRRFSQLASALPTPSIVSGQPSAGKTFSSSDAALSVMIPEEANVAQLRSLLKTANAELGRLKDKNQELQENHRQLERQHLEATHQIARLQDLERAQSSIYPRTHGDASPTSLGSPSTDGRVLDLASLNGGFGQRIGGGSVQSSKGSLAESNQTIQRLMKEVAALTSERDVLKIRSWELEKKPYMQQPPFHDVRSTDFIDLENERNRLIEELGQKTVAMEDLWNKNEALTLRATEYEKRVWELESQVTALEADCALLPRIRLDLVEMEARAVAADALVVKLQAMEGQAELVKNLQDRIQELETTNAELDHSNWDLSEKLNIANNQHGLLTREFESFRSKDKDDRRLEFLTNRNRELEAQLSAEQNKAAPDYKDEYERVSSELEKIKIRLPQLEGQSKQVALLRSKTLQLEKQIKTMEQLEPRLEEMQQLHERNLFLEGELGELEQLRAREMELEHELEAAKARVIQLETHKARMNSFSGLKQLQTRARSGSVVQPMAPFIPPALAQQQQQQQQQQQVAQDENETEEEKNRGVTTVKEDLRIRTSHGLSHLARSSQSITTTTEPILSPKREFPPTPTTASAWPSGRSSMSMSHASHRMSTSSNTSTVLSHSSNSPSLQWRTSQATYPSAPVSPSESLSPSILSLSSSSSSTLSDDESASCIEKNKASMTDEPESFLDHADEGDVAVLGLAPSPLLPTASIVHVDI